MKPVIPRLGLMALVALSLLAVPAAAVAGEPSFTSIDVPGALRTAALGINPRGDIVGWYESADRKVHGYLLRGGTFTSIDVPGAPFSLADGINPRGDVVGLFIDADGKEHGYLLSQR